jgi:hypothetical protein
MNEIIVKKMRRKGFSMNPSIPSRFLSSQGKAHPVWIYFWTPQKGAQICQKKSPKWNWIGCHVSNVRYTNPLISEKRKIFGDLMTSQIRYSAKR